MGSYLIYRLAENDINQSIKRIYILFTFFIHITQKIVKLVRKCMCKHRIRIRSIGFCGGRKTDECEDEPLEKG